MTAFVALLRREWLESRRSYLGVVLGLAALIGAVSSLAVVVSNFSGDSFVTVIQRIDHNGNSERREFSADNPAQLANFSNWTDRELTDRLTTLRTGIGTLFHATYFFTAAFVLLGCLYDERRDRSVLFWKSMPVSDWATIVSKLLVPAWLVPVIVVAALAATWVFVLVVFSIVAMTEDLGSAGRLWVHSGLGGGLLLEIVGYLVQGLWALPIYAWMLAVSAFAARSPLMWAVLAPVGVMLGERIVLGSSHVQQFVLGHLEFAALARTSDGDLTPAVRSVTDQLALLGTWELWLGVAVGVLLLAVATWCYRRFDEL